MTSAAREALHWRAGLAAVEAWEKQQGRLTAKEMEKGGPRGAGTILNAAKGAASGMRAVVYDAAVLVAAERNERRVWAKTRLGGNSA